MTHHTMIQWHHSKITKEKRQKLNQHKSCVLWFTGLSASGKSSLAVEIEVLLYQKEIRSYILDGDNIRDGLNCNLGFNPEDRKENIRRIGEVSKIFVDAGIIVLTAFISPYREDRDKVRAMFPKGEFVEIFLECSLNECERRDPKGLYKKARAGSIKDFTGISAPYEPPIRPEIIIRSDRMSIENSAALIMEYLSTHGYF